MKRFKKIIFLISISLFVITKVNAANASATSWRLYCEDTIVAEGESTKCYIMAQISNATGSGKNIRYVATEITGDKVFIETPDLNNPNYIAHGMPNKGTTINQSSVSHNQPYSTTFAHRATTCTAALGCYDFYKGTNGTILSDTTNAVSGIAENNGFTPIGYWNVYIDEDYITPDSDECARICLYVDYGLDGDTSYAHGLTPNINNGDGSCQEIHLTANPRCEYSGGTYYDRSGHAVTEAEYKADCFSCRHIGDKYYNKVGDEVSYSEYQSACFPKCKCSGNVCYNKEGQTVSEADYRKDCLSCKIDGNKYYNKAGEEVTKQQYNQDCLPSCKYDSANNKYYNRAHEEVTKEEYLKDCFSCKIENNIYHDKDGKEITKEQYYKVCACRCEGNVCYNRTAKQVTKEEYLKDCFSCRCENGQCYDFDGKPVTEEEYTRICKPKCEIVNDVYYNKDGKEVTKKEYIKSCACRIDNNKYYNDKGIEVTKEEYYKACNPICRCEKGQCYNHKGVPVTDKEYKRMCGCRKEKGKFYDADGKEVTEKEWNDKCVPATGSFIKYIVVIGFIAVFVGLYYYIKIYKAKKKIYKV